MFLLNVLPHRLAAIALLYLDQEDAFWSLVAIVEVFMPRDYYTKTLLGSQVSRQPLQLITSLAFNAKKLFTFANRDTLNVRNQLWGTFSQTKTLFKASAFSSCTF